MALDGLASPIGLPEAADVTACPTPPAAESLSIRPQPSSSCISFLITFSVLYERLGHSSLHPSLDMQ
jgi:hypothetical protein